MARQGEIKLEQQKSIKLLLSTNCYLAVRGAGNEFDLCKVIEDVLESRDPFKIKWLDRIDATRQLYKVTVLIFNLGLIILCSKVR